MPDYVLFWGHRPLPDGRIGKPCLSQWWPAEFVVDGTRYPTAEHFMMAGKARLFGDDAIAEKILATDSPREVKDLGRAVSGFDADRWTEHRYPIVVAGTYAKFSQNPALAGYLIGTGDKVIVEASPVDPVWGIGLAADHPDARTPAKWQGLNLLGQALMEVRARLLLGD
ncbi:MAG TPA: NADAR family protein [Actinokineospora sp.]|nr:NADAR family protein [Actinokineospora sp.]